MKFKSTRGHSQAVYSAKWLMSGVPEQKLEELILLAGNPKSQEKLYGHLSLILIASFCHLTPVVSVSYPWTETFQIVPVKVSELYQRSVEVCSHGSDCRNGTLS